MNFIISTLFILSIFLLIYYIRFLLGILRGLESVFNQKDRKSEYSFISVIVPFRNEEKNILNSLQSLASQSFPKTDYEVIFIDDNSDDSSFELLDRINKEENFVLLKSPYSNHSRAHKKRAITYSIERAKGDIIITTDADCTHGKDWLRTIVNSFDRETAFVSGPVEFKSNGDTFQDLQKLEFSSLILVGAGLIGIKNPIICNAANLGFRKSVFEEVGGYDDNIKLSSGDDEFLMQKIHRTTNYKIKFCAHKEAIAFTSPNESLNQFYQQRKRWASKGFHYTDKNIVMMLILIFLYYLSIPLQILGAFLVSNLFFFLVPISLILKFIIEYRIVIFAGKNLFNNIPEKVFLLAEFFHIPYIIISGIAGIFGNYKWKGRSIKR